ncbi:hypothetical protein [Hoeflea poritis]|uniref:Uncharacterized protein n=1 Tax=Hoeflea poritis TaxID=2993659 RepID=A0ABT4VJC9_9HYPH|nr:hypothetical protein [Hoeflea poritis]MDA4844133.1 hypothetical protein [Hoeflea poritis]
MRNFSKHAVTVSTVLTAPVTAFAHPGGHTGFDAAGAFAHIVSSPFHLALLLVAVSVAGIGFARFVLPALIRNRRR